MDPQALGELKRRLADRLLDEPGVSGVGLRDDGIVIYLESPDARARAKQLALKVAPAARIYFEVAGRFEKQ